MIIYYDGQCPLCCWEMAHLKQADAHNRIQLQDLHQPNFQHLFPHIDIDKAMTYLHGEAGGKMFYGLDVTYQAWAIVGKRHWVRYLRWPVLRHLFNWLYLWFAKHRLLLSKLIPLSPPCDGNQCQLRASQAKNNHDTHQQ